MVTGSRGRFTGANLWTADSVKTWPRLIVAHLSLVAYGSWPDVGPIADNVSLPGILLLQSLCLWSWQSLQL